MWRSVIEHNEMLRQKQHVRLNPSGLEQMPSFHVRVSILAVACEDGGGISNSCN